MQKGLGIAALVIAIIAVFIPFLGTWLTVLVAILAAFAAGEGFGLAIAAIIIDFIHIFVFSPLLWATQGMASAGAAAQGEEIVFLPWVLVGIQVVALTVLIMLNNKSKI
ncbi:MAG: hypothetical protein WCK96_05540 [Methylococcales bacterium]